MASQTRDFPFNIMDVAELLKLRIRRRQANSVYTDCPFCGDKRGKMNINFAKNVFRCNYCDEHGGMIALYARVCGIGSSEAYREICEALQTGLRAPEYEVKAAPQTPPPPLPNSEMADINVIHQTLSLLFEMLTLSETHRNNLRARGLTDEQIDRFGFKSTPPTYLCLSYTERLKKQGCTVQGVPGFYINDDGKWTVKFHKRTSGILIPIRGIDGLIRGAQIRLDVPIKDENEDSNKEGTKYLWFSSSNKYMGTTSGSPVHFVGDPFARVVYVTEGALKGYIAHCLMNRSFACIAGANNPGQLDPLLSILAHNGTQMIVEAHDMDKYRNEMIEKGASKIYLMASKYKMASRRLTWNPNYKGIDDWQLALRMKETEPTRKEGCKLNFKEQFISGLCGIDYLDKCAEAWHAAPEDGQELYEHLGLSEKEYADYLKTGNIEEILLAQRKRQRFRIYQLEFSASLNTKPYAFQGLKALHKAGYEQPPASDYRLVFDGELLCSVELSNQGILERIFERYNDSLPDGYFGRSISPSDIIELYDDDQRYYFYCDLPDFVTVRFSPKFALPMTLRT